MPSYPLLAIDQSGFTWLFANPDDCLTLPSGFVGILRRKRASMRFYSRDGDKWQLEDIQPLRRLSLLQKLFGAHNPTETSVTFVRLGDCSVKELIGALAAAVKADDDILTQRYSRDQILRQLEEATTFHQVFEVRRSLE